MWEGIGIFVFVFLFLKAIQCAQASGKGLKVRLREGGNRGQWSLSPEGLEQQPRMFVLKGALGSTDPSELGLTRPGGC